MRLAKPFLNIFLIITFISFIFHTQIQGSITTIQKRETSTTEIIKKIDKINNAKSLESLQIDDLLTIDEIFDLLESIQEDGFEEKHTEAELESIMTFIIFLARQGVLPGEEEELEKDIEELLSEDNDRDFSFASPYEGNYLIHPAISYDTNSQVFLTGFISHNFKKVVKFGKKHKKPLIIGTAVVAAGTITFFLCPPAAPAVANAAAGAVSAGSAAAAIVSSESSNNNEIVDKTIPKNDISSFIPDLSQPPLETNLALNETTALKETFEEHISVFKETIANEGILKPSSTLEKEEPSFLDKTSELAREAGAHLAHKIFDEISDYTKIMPEFMEEISESLKLVIPEDLLVKLDPNDLLVNSDKGIVENYEEKVFEGHQKIDEFFAVNQSDQYTKEAKEYSDNQFTQAILPPPNILFNNANALKNLANAGKVHDRGGLTKAGRALAKHGGRESSVFPKPMGTPMQINLQGQDILEQILNHPQKTITQQNLPKFGNVIDIKIPGKYGVRYYRNGEFIGFLEP